MSWFLCTISYDSPRNWGICKDVGAWGVSTQLENFRLDRVVIGDRLLVWLAKRGFVACGTVTAAMRRPINKADAPWPGGIHRFGAIVPFKLDLELAQPLRLPFENQKQKVTGIHAFQLRRGFIAIPDSAGEAAAVVMRDAKQNQLRETAASAQE